VKLTVTSKTGKMRCQSSNRDFFPWRGPDTGDASAVLQARNVLGDRVFEAHVTMAKERQHGHELGNTADAIHGVLIDGLCAEP